MPEYMMLVYEEEVDEAGQAERDQALPEMLELHRSLREAGRLLTVRALRSVQSATTVRVRADQADVTDGPFAVTKEVLAGYYLVQCADLDDALALARRLPMARWGTVEVRPVVSADDWSNMARRVGIDMSDEDLSTLA